ncbi:MAG: thiamine phosphate synthase [Rikenellaceae bacterium]|nr:thiamine phosphate synthase [Rikenellaceae bacterium]
MAVELYLVTDEALLRGRDLVWAVEEAVIGGVNMVQLREKHASPREFVEKAVALKTMLAPYGVPLIINDDVEVALAAGADGVHVGQGDMPVREVRRRLPRHAIVGLSVESREQVLEADALPVDYIAASPVFATPTKTDTVIEWGIEGVAWIRSVTRHRLVAIGGVKRDNAELIVRAGADSLAVISGILAPESPRMAAGEFRAVLDRCHGCY